MREQIVENIRQLAKLNDGRPPGRQLFERATGIPLSAWQGVYWARWGDALGEAGFAPNTLQTAIPENLLLEKLAAACRYFGRVPTGIELRMYGACNKTFPSAATFSYRFGRRSQMVGHLREWATAKEGYADIVAMLDDDRWQDAEEQPRGAIGGFVYLIASGPYFKIGRSDELERRVKEIRIALPDAAELVHSIRTDDPSGIEAYWHRRFSDKRANGEWFKLSRADVAAFKRRKYQ
jgi:hypothetical protein